MDVVTEHAGTLFVVEEVSKFLNLDPYSQILRFGDAGDFGGNDYELLSSGLSLSVETVPPGWAQCWNLLPRNLRGVRGTEHYLRGIEAHAGEARFTAEFLAQAERVVRDGLGRN